MPDLWRAFPWDPEAQNGKRFSPSYIPAKQGSGRFDLAGAPVLYLAETPEHAIAERIARFRGRALEQHHLREFGHTLALVQAEVPEADILDLGDPQQLARYRIRPDDIAARDVTVSQAVAARVHEQGFGGLRWWSSFFGEWHTVVLFLDRTAMSRIAFRSPRHVSLDDPAVRSAGEALGLRIG